MDKAVRADLIDALQVALRCAANPEYAIPMQKYMKSQMPYFGIKADPLRRIQRDIFKAYPLRSFDEYVTTIRHLWDTATYREERYTALGLAEKYPQYQTLEALPLYRHLIETGEWWDYVDMIAQHLIGGLLWHNRDVMELELGRWINDPHLWIRRSAVLAQTRFKGDTNEAMLFEFCEDHLHETSFWMRKAIGWALREYSKTRPEAVRGFIQRNEDRMSGVTMREARKYV